MKTATFIKQLQDWRGHAALYQLDPPLDGHRYVVVSSARAPFIFPANKDGQTVNMGEMTGSYRGGLSHQRVLQEAGYAIA